MPGGSEPAVGRLAMASTGEGIDDLVVLGQRPGAGRSTGPLTFTYEPVEPHAGRIDRPSRPNAGPATWTPTFNEFPENNICHH